MHPTARHHAEKFADQFCQNKGVFVEIGSFDVNGSLKETFGSYATEYIGLDQEAGKGVDMVLNDPYKWPLEDNSADYVVSSSCFEHAEFFWLLFLECARVCKPGGYIYFNAPSKNHYHGFPVDCWRFMEDSPQALANWAKRHNYNLEVIKASVDRGTPWEDCVGIFKKS